MPAIQPSPRSPKSWGAVPASLRGKEREIVILRSDNGETWKEHTLEATEDAVQEVLQESFDQEGNLGYFHLRFIFAFSSFLR